MRPRAFSRNLPQQPVTNPKPTTSEETESSSPMSADVPYEPYDLIVIHENSGCVLNVINY